MDSDAKPSRRGDRAIRLHREANNCVSTAVQARNPAYAAELLDEAVKLTRRSQELSREAAEPDDTPVAP